MTHPVPLNRPQAALELALWQAEAESTSSSDLYIWLRESGLPTEIAIRLKELVNVTKRIGGRMISIGKILLMKLIEFVKANPNLVIGMALGAMVSLLTTAIPILGVILAPVSVALGIAGGAILGHALDVGDNKRSRSGMGVVEIGQGAIEIARLFFELFIDTIRTLVEDAQEENAES